MWNVIWTDNWWSNLTPGTQALEILAQTGALPAPYPITAADLESAIGAQVVVQSPQLTAKSLVPELVDDPRFIYTLGHLEYAYTTQQAAVCPYVLGRLNKRPFTDTDVENAWIADLALANYDSREAARRGIEEISNVLKAVGSGQCKNLKRIIVVSAFANRLRDDLHALAADFARHGAALCWFDKGDFRSGYQAKQVFRLLDQTGVAGELERGRK